LDDEQGLSPGADLAGEQHQQRTIRRDHRRMLDTPARHVQLLAQEGVVREQLPPGAQQIRPRTRQMRCRWPHPEARAERLSRPDDEPTQLTTAPAKQQHEHAPYRVH